MQRSVCLKTTMPPFYILISHYPFLSHPIMPRHPTGIQTGFGFPHGRKTKYYNLKTCSSFPVRLEHAYFLVFVMPQYFTTNGNYGSGAEERIPFSSLTTACHSADTARQPLSTAQYTIGQGEIVNKYVAYITRWPIWQA
jgi:hypothetical protein